MKLVEHKPAPVVPPPSTFDLVELDVDEVILIREAVVFYQQHRAFSKTKSDAICAHILVTIAGTKL